MAAEYLTPVTRYTGLFQLVEKIDSGFTNIDKRKHRLISFSRCIVVVVYQVV
jgi:hypothetical protein